MSSAGTVKKVSSVSSGDISSIRNSDSTSSTTLPVSIGMNCRSCCTSCEVGAGTRHELTGGELVVPGEVEALEPFEQRVPQVVLHVDGVTAARVPTDVLEDEVHRREADEQHEQRTDRLGLRGDGVVDDRPLHERQDRRDHLAEDRDPEGDQHALLVAYEERPELPQPAGFRRCLHCWAATPAPADPRASRASRAVVLRRERARELRERVVHDGRVGYVGEERVEPLAHRVLGDSQRGASRGSDREPDRAAVTVDGGALQEPVGDQRLDRGRDGGAGQRQLPGEPARPLLAAHDQRQEPVLGEREVGARPLERAGDPDQGEDLPVGAFLRRAHAESIANSSGTKQLPTQLSCRGARGTRSGAEGARRERASSEPGYPRLVASDQRALCHFAVTGWKHPLFTFSLW